MASNENKEIVYLKPDEILIPEERVTSQLDPEILNELRESIKQHGILEPLLVGLVDGKYVLIDGLHRLMIAKELGLEKVPCVVKPMSEAELLITNLIVNRQRGRSNPAHEAKVLATLVDRYGISLAEAAQKLGMSKSTAEKYYRIARHLHPQLLEALGQGLLSVGCAYWLTFIEDMNKQLEVGRAAIEFGYTVEQCKEAARQALHPEVPPPPGGWTFDESGRPVRVPIRCAVCGGELYPEEAIYIPVHRECKEVLDIVAQQFMQEQQASQQEQQQQTQELSTPVPESTLAVPQAAPSSTTTVPEETPRPETREKKDWWPF